MKIRQSKKSEQITIDKKIVYDYDQPIKKQSEILKIYQNIFGENKCGIEKYENKAVYFYKNKNIKHYFLTASITWLSNPHPFFKKRIQLKDWYKNFYKNKTKEQNIQIHLIGLYRYGENIIFTEFKLEDYIDKKMHSSSAHVYSNDLYQAMINSYFTKKDNRNNTVTTVKYDNFKNYIENNLEESKIQEIFEAFNQNFVFNQWLTAEKAIIEMRDNNWYNWKQTEWAGWFLEYKLDKFLKTENYENVITYVGNQKNNIIDFDLYFNEDKFYGDLKASDINQTDIIGNDKNNVEKVLNEYGKLWYIIYEHDTIKDKERNSQMAIERMKLIGTGYQSGDKISYKSRMKHSVKFLKMKILEVNKINMNEILSDFKQGKQPNGTERNLKIKINKKELEKYINKYENNFLIYSFNN